MEQVPPKVGIEHLKKAAKFGIQLGEQFNTALSDGKLTWTDSFGFFDELIQVPGLLKDGKDIAAEVKDLDVTEREELYDYISQEFAIEDKDVEAKVEGGLKLAVEMLNYIDLFRKKAA